MLKSKDKFYCPHVGCKISYDNMLSLSHHWSRTHKLSQKSLYLILNNFKQEPTCKCGCGEEVKFLGSVKGFCEYKLGHAARVSNNFQTQKSVTNSKASRKRMHQNREIKIWNSGLTKETDKRLEDLGNKTREWLERCPEERIKKSERMKRQRQDGTTVSPSGTKSGMWKGGTSSLYAVCHSNRNFYNGWKYPILAKAKFSCSICRDSTLLEVHHDKEQMSDIVKKIAKEHLWEESLSLKLQADDPELFEKKQVISDAVADYHITNNVSGIVLCKTCHKQEHNSHNL